jgi:hypothetical protein
MMEFLLTVVGRWGVSTGQVRPGFFPNPKRDSPKTNLPIRTSVDQVIAVDPQPLSLFPFGSLPDYRSKLMRLLLE